MRYLIAALLFVALPIITSAHHSAIGRFDREAIMEIEGEVTEILWRNPHAAFRINVAEQNGEAVTWLVEGNTPNRLERSGISADSVKIGDRVRAAGWPPLTSKKEIFGTNLLLPSGEELFLEGGVEPRWADEGTGDRSFQYQTDGDASRPELGLFRVWSHTSLIPFLFPEAVDPSVDVSRYPMTAEAVAALQNFDRATDNPTRNCSPKGMPTIMEQPYPMEFVRDGDNIVLRIEEYDTRRVIYMDTSTTPDNAPASLLGYSVGRWEGSALVVTTTNMSWPFFNQLGVPQSGESVLTERFEPTDDGSRLYYTLTVVDPVNFTEPVTLQKHWLYLPDEQVRPFECQEIE